MVLLGWLVQSDQAFFEILDNIRVRNLADGIAFIGRCVNRPLRESPACGICICRG